MRRLLLLLSLAVASVIGVGASSGSAFAGTCTFTAAAPYVSNGMPQTRSTITCNTAIYALYNSDTLYTNDAPDTYNWSTPWTGYYFPSQTLFTYTYTFPFQQTCPRTGWHYWGHHSATYVWFYGDSNYTVEYITPESALTYMHCD